RRRRQCAARQGQSDRFAHRGARRRRSGPAQRVPVDDEPPLRRDRGRDDRRSGRGDQLRPDQDGRPGPLRAGRQVQPAPAHRGGARRRRRLRRCGCLPALSGLTGPMAGTPRRRPARTGAKGATRRPPTRPGATGRRHTARGRTGEAKEGTRRRRVVMTTRRWVGLGSVLALLALMLVPTGKSWYDQRQRLDELNEQVAAQEANVDELEREKELWET